MSGFGVRQKTREVGLDGDLGRVKETTGVRQFTVVLTLSL